MSDFYDSIIATARRMLEKFGESVFIQKSISETFDPVTGANTDSKQMFETVGLLTEFKYLYGGENTTAKRFDKMFILADYVKPDIKDSIYYNDELYAIEEVSKIAPVGEPIIYKVIVKK